MLEGHDGPVVEAEAGVPFDNHRLLLSLAGLIDDELLGWSRELAAVGEFDHALELVTAAIAADGVRLPEAVHAALLAARRGQPGVEVPEPEECPVPAHRFLPDPTAAGYPAVVGGGSPVEALGGLPDRLLRDCRLWLSWRLTPAGAAPAPVPHPVLLVEAGDGVGADLLAYQVADLLWQAGVFASVEVFGPDTPVGEYHRAALDASVALDELGGKGASATGASASPDDAPPTASALLGAPVFPDTPARETSSTPARETSSRPPLRPVERVIAARASAPRNPIDNVMPFERTPPDRPLPDRQPLQDRPLPDRQPLQDRPLPDRQPLQDRPLPERQPLQERPVQGPDRGGYDPFDSPGERPSGEPVRGSRRDQRPSAPRDQRNRPRDEAFGPPPGLVRPPAPNFGHTDWQSSGPPTAPPGPP
ncbi:MAG: hypothetical protein M3Z25_22085, partial [Actinomycetota bacterium]|nr:hypothetical protein [Actinomycetota bacterium]